MNLISRNKIVILCCALSGHAVNIIPFSFGIFLPYVFSYLRQFDASVTLSNMHLHAPLCLAVATGTAWTFGIFQKYIHERVLHIVNAVGLTMWMVLLYFFGSNFYFLTLAIGCYGFHSGQLHVYFSQRVTEEGKNYPGIANGIYGFFFGLAGIWGNIMGGALINPSSVKPQIVKSNFSSSGSTYIFRDEGVLHMVPLNWAILAIITFILLLPGFFVIAKTKDDEEKRRLLSKNEANDYQTEYGEHKKSRELSIFSATGLTLFLITIGIGVSSMSAFDLFKDYGLKVIDDDNFLNVAGIIIPIIGAIGRITWGALGDKLSFRYLFVSGNMMAFLLQCMMYPSRKNKYHYVLNTAVLSIMPGMMTLLPPAVKLYMGRHNIALKYGLVLTGEVIGCVFYLLLTSFLRKFLNDLVLVILLGLPAALSVIPTCIFVRNIKP